MTYQSINPYTEQVVESFQEHSDEEISRILASADRTYREDWRDRSFESRAAILKKAAALLREQRADYARTATLEVGKLLNEALGEVEDSATILEYYADNAARILAPTEVVVKQGRASVQSVPLGIIFCIEPWNYPYYQLARVVGPNLMAGNTVIVKHANGVPLCALAFEICCVRERSRVRPKALTPTSLPPTSRRPASSPTLVCGVLH